MTSKKKDSQCLFTFTSTPLVSGSVLWLASKAFFYIPFPLTYMVFHGKGLVLTAFFGIFIYSLAWWHVEKRRVSFLVDFFVSLSCLPSHFYCICERSHSISVALYVLR